jgi:hypothetical protein
VVDQKRDHTRPPFVSENSSLPSSLPGSQPKALGRSFFAQNVLFANGAPYTATEIAIVLCVVRRMTLQPDSGEEACFLSDGAIARMVRASAHTVKRWITKHCARPEALIRRSWPGATWGSDGAWHAHRTARYTLLRTPAQRTEAQTAEQEHQRVERAKAAKRSSARKQPDHAARQQAPSLANLVQPNASGASPICSDEHGHFGAPAPSQIGRDIEISLTEKPDRGECATRTVTPAGELLPTDPPIAPGLKRSSSHSFRYHARCRPPCARVCVSKHQHEVLRGLIGGHCPDQELDAFYQRVRERLGPTTRVTGTAWTFWMQAYEAEYAQGLAIRSTNRPSVEEHNAAVFGGLRADRYRS